MFSLMFACLRLYYNDVLTHTYELNDGLIY